MSHLSTLRLCTILFALSLPVAATVAGAGDWWGSFGATGLNGAVRCLLEADGVLYAGGDFSKVDAGTLEAPHVAYWRQGRWTSLGYGLNGPVVDLALYQGRIVAAGEFTQTDEDHSFTRVTNIAVWGNGVWRQDIGPLSGAVSDLLVVGDSLFAVVVVSPGVAVTRIMLWHAESWTEVRLGGLTHARRLAWFNGSLHAAGDAGIFRYDRNGSWVSLQEPEEAVTAGMVVWGGRLVVAGSGLLRPNHGLMEVAAWDGLRWESLGEGRGTIEGLDVDRGSLYLVGEVETFTGGVAGKVLRLLPDASGWAGLADSVSGRVLTLKSTPDGLFVGGERRADDGATYGLVASWNDPSWEYRNGGLMLGDVPYAMAPFQDGLVVAGTFASAGRDSLPYIANLKGGRWRPLGGGVNDHVWAILPLDDRLVVAGAFDSAGGESAARIATWDGTAWAPLGAGFDGNVYSLCVYRGHLFAGGGFRHSGSRVTNNIAWWDGAEWRELGSGVDSWVTALAECQGRLWVGGFFNSAGGIVTPKLATWDESAWAGTNAGLPEYASIRAIAAFRDEVYVGGRFDVIGGVRSQSIARTDGLTWRAVGGGLRSNVEVLLNTRNRLFVGSAGDGVQGISRAAFWDGTQWDGQHALNITGSAGDYVSCVTEVDGSLYLGGEFGGVGTRGPSGNVDRMTSLRIARWDAFSELVPLSMANLNATRSGGAVVIEWDAADGAELVSGLKLLRGHSNGDRERVDATWARTGSRFTIRDLNPPNETTSYWVQLIERDGTVDVLGPALVEVVTGTQAVRLSATPNPFSRMVRIEIEAAASVPATVHIFDVRGRLVRRLDTQPSESGWCEALWDGRDERTRDVPAGVYFARVPGVASVPSRRLVKIP